MSAYPTFPAKVASFRYHSDLHLTRTMQSVRRREGEDADYLLADRYDCSILVETRDGAEFSHHITVPPELITDLSSVPRLARAD